MNDCEGRNLLPELEKKGNAEAVKRLYVAEGGEEEGRR